MCACGFDFATGEVTVAAARARRDLHTGRSHQLLGFAGVAAIALLCASAPVWAVIRSYLSTGTTRDVTIMLCIPIAAVVELARGIQLSRDARRRLRTALALGQLPPARVIQRAPQRAARG